MGVVYLATQRELRRKVALKLLSDELAADADFRARFERESRLAASIDHPNIVPLYEAGEIDGAAYLAMRYVEGVDLATRLREGPIEPAEAAAILGQVAGALDAAHERGLVHRDVKPGNVLLGRTAHGDHAYLTDFGLTKQAGSETGITRAGSFVGTPAYMAPEQIQGQDVDGRADQYSLAAMAFECLTGQVPFERDQEFAVAWAQVRDAVPAASSTRPGLPPGRRRRPDPGHGEGSRGPLRLVHGLHRRPRRRARRRRRQRPSPLNPVILLAAYAARHRGRRRTWAARRGWLSLGRGRARRLGVSSHVPAASIGLAGGRLSDAEPFANSGCIPKRR